MLFTAYVFAADTVGPPSCLKGATPIKLPAGTTTLDAAAAYANTLANPPYSCRQTTARTVVGVQPPNNTKSATCVAPTVGTWTQTQSYALSSSNVWVTGAWLPAKAPVGACTTPDPIPPVVVPPVVVVPPLMHGGITVDVTTLMKPAVGRGSDMLAQTTDIAKPTPDGIGAFRSVCSPSHMAFDDPIVYPGQPGVPHLHTFFGNTGLNAYSTALSIATTGNSTCRGATINRTGYWVPTMIDTKDNSAIVPQSLITYYKTGYNGIAASAVKAFPQGLRMIAGDPTRKAPEEWGPTKFGCMDNTTANIVGAWAWQIPDCVTGNTLWMVVSFPQCWDGVNLDSPDHKSHMNYPTKGACPATHPVPVPEISYNILYPIVESHATLRWRLSSDAYDKTLPAGYSAHGDWFNGWKPDIMATWIKNCDNAAVDCQAHMLGDGRMMLSFDGN